MRAVIDEALKKIAILDVIYLENLGHERRGVSVFQNAKLFSSDYGRG